MSRKNKNSKKEISGGRPAKRISMLRHVTGSENFEENRKSARLDMAIKIYYRVIGKDDDRRGSVTKNISSGGCLLLTAEKIDINSYLELEILLGDGKPEALKLRGKIARLNREEGDLYEYGIIFDGLSAQCRRLFADFCFSKMYEMIGLPEWPTDRALKKNRGGEDV